MTFGGAPSVFRLRQAHPTGNSRFCLITLALFAYTFAGFGVYWLKTGSGTVGEGGTVSNLGGLIWFFPIAIGFPAILFIEDRGPLRALYDLRTTVTVGPDGLTWWTAKGGDGRLAWSELGGVSRITGKYSTYEAVFALSGEEVVGFEGPFKVEGRRKSVSLPVIILEARPKAFVAADPRHPERGCIMAVAA
jgi:hypothetical protein